MRRLLFGLVVLTLLLAGASGYADVKSAEDATLDDVARAEAAGGFISLTHGTTHYELTGPSSGRLVVLVNGFSVPYYIWDSTAVALKGFGYRVLRNDFLGRGFSDRPGETYDGAFHVEQLGALLGRALSGVSALSRPPAQSLAGGRSSDSAPAPSSVLDARWLAHAG